MSLAFYASPIDYKNNDLENKIKSEKTKLDKNTLMTFQQGSLQESPTDVTDIHKNLKEDNDTELSNFYKSEMNNVVLPEIKTNQYMLMDDNNVEKYKAGTNDELLSKLDRMIEMFEEQKEIKTTQKNEEIVLYSFLGVFTIYILDTFVSIGKYTR